MILYVQVERNLIEMYVHNLRNNSHILFKFNLLINLKSGFDINLIYLTLNYLRHYLSLSLYFLYVCCICYYISPFLPKEI